MGWYDRSFGIAVAARQSAHVPADRRRLDKAALHLDAHFHSLPEQRAMVCGCPPFHDLERIARQSTGYAPDDLGA